MFQVEPESDWAVLGYPTSRWPAGGPLASGPLRWLRLRTASGTNGHPSWPSRWSDRPGQTSTSRRPFPAPAPAETTGPARRTLPKPIADPATPAIFYRALDITSSTTITDRTLNRMNGTVMKGRKLYYTVPAIKSPTEVENFNWIDWKIKYQNKSIVSKFRLGW